MNDQGSGWPPDFEDDEAEKRRAQAVQRAFMDRARRAVEYEQRPVKRPVAHRVVALAAALGLTFGIVYAFDAFLGGVQRVMHLLDEQEERQKQEEIERKKKEPIPAYVVPSN